METKAKTKNNSSTKSRKRSEPFTDLTNFNLIPISSLRNLCKSTKPSTNLPADSILQKSPQNSSSKSYNLRNSKSHITVSDADSNYASSKSDTSIGSSNFNQNAAANAAVNPNPAAEVTTPSRRVPPPQTPPLGYGGNELVYSRRETDQKAKKSKGKEIAMPSSSPITYEKRKSVLLGFSPIEKSKEKVKLLSEFSSHHNPSKNIKDVGKEIAASYDHPSETRNIRGKANVMPITCSPLRTENLGQSIAMLSSCLPSQKQEENVKKKIAAFSCPPRPRRVSMRKSKEPGDMPPPKSWTDPQPKKRKVLQKRFEDDSEFWGPRDFVEQQRAYFKEIDAYELVEEEISEEDLDND